MRKVEGYRHAFRTARPTHDKGFHDEVLSGEWSGHRSSRLGVQYRVIYRTTPEQQLFQVVSITAHDYRRP